MSATVHIDELNPETRARVLEQLSGTEGTTALATVEKETFTTLGDPATMTDDQLADIVIEGVKKIRRCLPYIVAMKARFEMGDRDRTNRLKTPIKGCYSWKEFCKTRLDRAPQTIGEALAPEPSPNAKPVACTCPDCGQPFPSRGQLRKHGQTEHNISSTGIADFLKRSDGGESTRPSSAPVEPEALAPEPADEPQPAPEPTPAPTEPSKTVQLREWFTTKFKAFKVEPSPRDRRGVGSYADRYDLTLYNQTPEEIKAIGEWLVRGER